MYQALENTNGRYQKKKKAMCIGDDTNLRGERVVALGLPRAGAHVPVGMRDLPQRGDGEADREVGDVVGEDVGGVGDADPAAARSRRSWPPRASQTCGWAAGRRGVPAWLVPHQSATRASPARVKNDSARFLGI